MNKNQRQGKMQIDVFGNDKEYHEVITTAIRDFGQLGYFIQSIAYRHGVLEVICTYPHSEKQEQVQKDSTATSFIPL
jgi:hypothetical protein